MKKFSILSIVLMLIGLLLFGLNGIVDGYSELIILFSFISFLVGILLSFIAVAKQEKGTLKFISLIFFFVAMSLITWFEPSQVLRMITWFKNIS